VKALILVWRFQKRKYNSVSWLVSHSIRHDNIKTFLNWKLHQKQPLVVVVVVNTLHSDVLCINENLTYAHIKVLRICFPNFLFLWIPFFFVFLTEDIVRSVLSRISFPTRLWNSFHAFKLLSFLLPSHRTTTKYYI